jgi:hypothetical protein
MRTTFSEQYEQTVGEPTDKTAQGEATELELWRRVRNLVRDGGHEDVKMIADQQIQKREAALLHLWEILVPVASNEGIPFSEDHHEAFRRILRALPSNSGTTSRPAGDGDWQDQDTGKVFVEKMIPIRFRACRADAERMVAHVLKFYRQIAVMAYKVADARDVIYVEAEN